MEARFAEPRQRGADIEKVVKPAFKELLNSKKIEIFNSMSENLKNSLEIETLLDLTPQKLNEMIDGIVK